MLDPQTIYAGLISRGLNPAQAYATLGNWKQESELNPAAYNPGEGAIGLDQWRLGRADALRNFAASTGRSVNDPNVQMDYYVNELKSHPGGSAFLAANDIPSANSALKTFIAYGSPYNMGGEGTRLQNALAYQKMGFDGGMSGPPDHYAGNLYSALGATNPPPSPFAPTAVAGSDAPDSTSLGLTGQQGNDIASILAQNDPNSPHNRLMAAFQKLGQMPNAPMPYGRGGGDARSSGYDLLRALQANGLNLSQLLLKQRLG